MDGITNRNSSSLDGTFSKDGRSPTLKCDRRVVLVVIVCVSFESCMSLQRDVLELRLFLPSTVVLARVLVLVLVVLVLVLVLPWMEETIATPSHVSRFSYMLQKEHTR